MEETLIPRGGSRQTLQKVQAVQEGYLPGWTEEVFVVSGVKKGRVPTYKVNEWDGMAVKLTFYAEDLQKVTVVDDDLFRIEKVIKRKGECVGKVGQTSTTLG